MKPVFYLIIWCVRIFYYYRLFCVFVLKCVCVYVRVCVVRACVRALSRSLPFLEYIPVVCIRCMFPEYMCMCMCIVYFRNNSNSHVDSTY